MQLYNYNVSDDVERGLISVRYNFGTPFPKMIFRVKRANKGHHTEISSYIYSNLWKKNIYIFNKKLFSCTNL